MKKVKLALLAAAAIFCFSCGGGAEADFSIVPIKGANGEYQYIDLAQKGKIVINPQFSKAHIFRDGLALVKASGSDGKWGYIDKKGKFAIAPVYIKAQDFGNGVAWVQLEDQPPALIDKDGKTILQIDSLTAAYPFNNGAAGIKVYSQRQESTIFINKKGELVAITDAKEYVFPVIKDGLYIFQDKDTKKRGYKNKTGEIAIPAQFDDISFFADEMAVTLNGNKWGAINKKGEFIIDPQYDSLEYDGNGLFVAKVGKKRGWVNKKNEIVINPQFDMTTGFGGNKLSAVQMGDKWGYIDKEGQIKINPQFRLAFPFSGDYAMIVNDDGKVGFIDQNGIFVVPPLYDVNKNDLYEYALEYGFAISQNLYGLPMQYLMRYMYPKEHDYQNGDFYTYARLEEKKEEERKRLIAAASGSLTDSRDDKTYKTIKIGTQTWMAENLNYVGDGYIGLCYGDRPREQIRNPENCEKYGRLYDWSEAMGLEGKYNQSKFGSVDENVQGICPSGWHLPSKEDWNDLMAAVGGDNVAGKKLRAKNGWDNNDNGTDDYGFSALPGGEGYSNGYFKSIGSFGYWRSATESSALRTYTINMDKNSSRLRWDNDDKSGLSYVRCVKDYEATASEKAAAEKAATEAKENAKASVKSFADSRDGKSYKTVAIGKQTWMAENLNYEVKGGECYNKDQENCEKYGRLYNWATAMKSCPSGWHLPSNEEWDALYRIVDGSVGDRSPYRSGTAGKYLKATSEWSDFKGSSGSGLDAYGFAALPGGSNYSGSFNHLGNNGYWWSASENSDGGAYYRFILYESEIAGWNSNSKAMLLSVRCVKD